MQKVKTFTTVYISLIPHCLGTSKLMLLISWLQWMARPSTLVLNIENYSGSSPIFLLDEYLIGSQLYSILENYHQTLQFNIISTNFTFQCCGLWQNSQIKVKDSINRPQAKRLSIHACLLMKVPIYVNKFYKKTFRELLWCMLCKWAGLQINLCCKMLWTKCAKQDMANQWNARTDH